MSNSHKTILFFSRDYQSQLFPHLVIDGYTCVHVTLTKHEKQNVLEKGGTVVGCLEEEFQTLKEANIEYPYLKFSWTADRYLIGFDYKTRLSIQKKVVSFWRGILDKFEPIAVVNEPIAIEVSEIMYLEAKRKNIRYLALSSFMAQDRLIFQPNPFDGSFAKQIFIKDPDPYYIEKAKIIVADVKNGKAKPSYVIGLKSRGSFSIFFKILKSLALDVKKKLEIRDAILRRLCHGDHFDYNFVSLVLYMKSFFLSYKYDKIENFPTKTDIIFFPLHYEPEATIIYCSYFNSDQDSFISNIIRCICENQILVVKEHPNQPGFLLQNKFLKLKKKYSNLFFLPAEKSSWDLIINCKALITLGSTAGFEALVLGKNVINFGKMYYDNYLGIHNMRSFEELYKLLRNNDFIEKKEDIVYYIAKTLEYMSDGNPFPHNNLFEKNNLKAISNSIEKELRDCRNYNKS